MTSMKTILGILGIIAGVALGLYVGVWLMFVGGILGIVNFIQLMIDGNTDGMLLAISIVKLVFSGAVGAISFYVLALPSIALLSKK